MHTRTCARTHMHTHTQMHTHKRFVRGQESCCIKCAASGNGRSAKSTENRTLVARRPWQPLALLEASPGILSFVRARTCNVALEHSKNMLVGNTRTAQLSPYGVTIHGAVRCSSIAWRIFARARTCQKNHAVSDMQMRMAYCSNTHIQTSRSRQEIPSLERALSPSCSVSLSLSDSVPLSVIHKPSLSLSRALSLFLSAFTPLSLALSLSLARAFSLSLSRCGACRRQVRTTVRSAKSVKISTRGPM